MPNLSSFPDFGFLRLRHIIGDKNTPPIIPVSRTTWWNGVKSGEYPSPIKLSEGVTVWRTSDIKDLVKKLERQSAA